MKTQKLKMLADYLDSNELPDWDFTQLCHCAVGNALKIFPEFADIVTKETHGIIESWRRSGLTFDLVATFFEISEAINDALFLNEGEARMYTDFPYRQECLTPKQVAANIRHLIGQEI